MDLLKIKIDRALATINRIHEYAADLNPDASVEDLKSRLRRLSEAFANAKEFQDKWIEFSAEEDYTSREVEFEVAEDEFMDAEGWLNHAIADFTGTRSNPTTDDTVNSPVGVQSLVDQQTIFLQKFSEACSSSHLVNDMKLPPLAIAPFSGNYSEWLAFKDAFLGSVDKKEIPDSIKFRYLCGLLRGEALNLVKHTPKTDKNYRDAWERLEKRYKKPRHIINSHIKSFFGIKSISQPSNLGIRSIWEAADNSIRGLKAVGSDAEHRDPWLVYILLEKLDDSTRKAWAIKSQSCESDSIEFFLDFLDQRASALETLSPNKTPNHAKSTKFNPVKGFHSNIQPNSNTSTLSLCPKCQESHNLFLCPAFAQLDITSRRNFVKEQSLCFNCLRPGHNSSRCRSKHRCQNCNFRHHTLVCQNKSANNTRRTNHTNKISSQQNFAANAATISATSTPSSSSHHLQSNFTQDYSLNNSPTQSSNAIFNAHHSTQIVNYCSNNLLPIAVVNIRDKWNNICSCRILLDSGSQISFISEKLAQKLNLPRRNASLPILGLSATNIGKTKGLLSLQLQSRFSSEYVIVEAFVLQNLTSLIPHASFSIDEASQLSSSLQLADENFNKAAPIDMIIGADKFFDVIKAGRIENNKNTVAVETIFGWVVVGKSAQFSSNPQPTTDSILAAHADIDIGQMLQRFFEVEDVPTKPGFSMEEKLVENHFLTTHSRSKEGKYIVELPFKSTPEFGNSLTAALSRFHSMERKFKQNSTLKEKYVRFMTEYETLGHMQLIEENNLKMANNEHFYLPHHAVFKKDSDKIRVVFDGSVKTANGISLNDSLHSGPPIQRDLLAVCLRFRRHRYVFSADIQQMYRQILVAQSHTNYQRIVWRADSNKPICHYKLNTVTYGTSAAPFLAVRTLQQLAMDYVDSHQLASEVLLKDFYVDDVMTGADSVSEILELKDQLVDLLDLGGFPLRKWSSNCWPMLQSLPSNHCELSSINIEDSDSSIKVLGLKWFPGSDNFSYKVNLRSSNTITKRQILSESSKIFDPLGFLTPAVLPIKILYQRLWAENLEWDDELPNHLAREWCLLRDQICLFENVKIPRKLWCQNNNVEYHGFADASQYAYAAVIYCRSVAKDGKVHTNLVLAKSKVAPSKRVLSIPKLELCAALLLCRLFTTLQDSLHITPASIFGWTDSKVVLDWLSSSPRRWKIFVANRTSEILDVIPREKWQHVSTTTNPADCASRGITPTELIKHPKWWSGPDWLKLNSSTWPESYCQNETSSEVLNEERSKPIQSMLITFSTEILEKLFEKHSSWTKVLRILAYCFRFIIATNCRRNVATATVHGELKAFEIRNAKYFCLRWAQQSSFAEEINSINCQQKIKRGSQLKELTPFLCNNNLLRVKGRLIHSSLDFSSKHPIILPKHHIVTKHIINNLHLTSFHAGASLMFAILRQEYWILGSRNLLRSAVKNCLKCFRQRQQTLNQIMADLPSVRVQYAPPFTKVGIDYAGPIPIRLSKRRNAQTSKGFIALFVCMATKAVHIEFVSDLTTDAFIAALRRFFAIRGKCTDLYSDNGTAFRGAHRSISEMHRLVQAQHHNELVQRYLVDDGIQWHFIPPVSPHFGGLWEAGVKSVKEHLKRVVGNHMLTYEEMCTVLTQISAILNSRPLCAISDTDLNPLTPSHFLIGRPYTTLADPDVTCLQTNRLSNWQLLQQMVQGFWKRWHQEYLTSLQERPKWQNINRELRVGDLVVVKDKNLPPSKWLMARIINLHPGSDGISRVVDLKTAHGVFTRNITALSLLPIS